MAPHRFFITDVFAVGPYTGNQLATFFGCTDLSPAEMQRIAREINFSETTFVLSGDQRDGGYDVRIFTPGNEVPFAGHPTLGTAYLIRRHLQNDPAPTVTLNLQAGAIPVSFPDDGSALLWMSQVEPVFGPVHDAARLTRLLGLTSADIDSRGPVQEVSTGLPFTIVPLRTMAALKRVRVQMELYLDFCREASAPGILIFAPEPYDRRQSLSVRVFVDCYGIPEDPATGSGNGCLAAYLVKHRYFGTSSIDVLAGQGYEIGRPSELALRAREEAGCLAVEVGGRVIQVAEGVWGE